MASISVKTPDDTENIKTKISVCMNVDRNDITLVPLNVNGRNYLGSIYNVTVNHRTKPIEKYVLKTAPKNLDVRENVPIRKFYTQEAFAYNKLFNVYDQLQCDAKIPNTGKLKFVKCVYSNTQYLEEALLLEDLTEQGFYVIEDERCKDLSYVRLIMECLSKYHCLSFVLEKRNPHLFSEISKFSLPLTVKESDEKRLKHAESCLQKAIQALDNETHKDKLRNLTGAKVFREIANVFAAREIRVLCHGDCWTNNIMVKYQNNIPLEVRLIDFQILRYASPVTDLIYFLLCCTDIHFRAQHLNDLLSYYYDTTRSFIRYFDLDIEQIYPRAVFDEDVEDLYKFGFYSAIVYLPFMTGPEDTQGFEEIFDKDSECEMNIHSSEKYKTIMRGLVKECVERNIL